ncbi:MAG: xanthine dehydrogenase family protein molybdopterin-binding subunit [Opitutaceae bacterium]
MAWPKETKFLGKRTTRIDGIAKVTGTAKYSSDVQPEGWLFGMILRSKWPAALIQSIDLDKARKHPGIKAAILIREGSRNIRYYGEELAAVAGVSKQACLDALQLIRVKANSQPFVVNEGVAMAEGAPKVFEGESNVGEATLEQRGDPDAAFAAAHTVVEGFFSTQIQLHHPLETHGTTADFRSDELTSWASTQGIFSVRDGLADALEIPQNKVRVISDFMGGGFGAKFGAGVEGVVAARLSKEAGAPVKLMLTRFDEALAVGNRPSSFQRIRLGSDHEGKLTAFDMDSFGSAGYASGGETAGGGGGAGFPAPYIYPIENVRVKQAGVAINAGSARAFRAPGHPQASFGMESVLDQLAASLGMDPLEIRLRNDPSETRRKEYKLAAEKIDWAGKWHPPGKTPGPIKSGLGCAGATWGGGGGGTKAEAIVNSDGTVEIHCGTQDLGTGTKTLIAVIAAELFGLEPTDIIVRIGDTRFPPSGGSGGSTTAASVSPAIYDLCQNVIAELEKVSGLEDVRGTSWKAACRKIGINPLTVQGQWQKGLSSSGVGGVQMIEVDVDTETGFVHVRKVVCVQDCGLIVNKLTCESQVNGGIIMGLGYALYENRVMDDATGVVLNPNFETYKLPGAADIPDIEIYLIDMPERGVIGVGEPVTIPTASAVANAVANAIGVRVDSLPITPDKVLAALGKVPNRTPELARAASQRLFESFNRISLSPFAQDKVLPV